MTYELWVRKKVINSVDYDEYLKYKTEKKTAALQIDEEEKFAIKKQNVVGLKMISFSLVFIAVLMLILAFITSDENVLVASIVIAVLLSATIHWKASRR